MLQTNKATVFIAWFPETQQQLQYYFTQQNEAGATVILCTVATTHNTNNNPVIFVEHFPLRKKEHGLFYSFILYTA